MFQRRLDAYFSVPLRLRPPSSKSFLDLPYGTRRRIYILAGLVRFCPIELNREGLRGVLRPEGPENRCFYQRRRFDGKFYGINRGVVPCRCPALPSSLLYVSRTVSREVIFILYSENKFTICRNESRGLNPLQNLSYNALAALRSLTVRLNNCSCVYGYCSFPDRTVWPRRTVFPCHKLCKTDGLHDRPMGHRARQDKATLRIWYDLVGLLASHVSPGLINFSIVCDTKDLDTAYQVVAPLSQFPLLRNCSIRLGETLNWELNNLARTQTARLLGQPMDTDATSYSYHLPEEIIERILGYTELIAPYDLEWMPKKGLFPFDCCKKCTDTLDCCSCSFYHAAYSSTCTCWRLSMSIFLTSHIVRRIATALFYSGNKFVLFLNGIDKWRPYQCSTSLRSPLAQFIKALPKEALPHLRRVVLTFLGLDPEEFLQDERKVTEWEKAIDLLDREVNLPKLTLVLDIDEWYLGQDPALSKAQHLDIYMRILQPLIRIRGIRNFFVFLKPRALYGREIACILEKSVVGPEYDAVANGKPEERRRRWNDGYCYEPVFGPDGRMLSPTPPPPKPWESSSSEDEGQYW